ncbi:MAG: T9SS type A sorting domain-containing protein [Calditrichaeota bacterium]|nr:T9SS type A sorting domain-containing protein [Calditrichota bacterium]
MKRLLIFLLLLPQLALASFWAKNLTYSGHNWNTFKMKQLSCDVEVYGLFYQTTITYEIALTPTNWDSPHSGTYEIYWDFTLVNDAVITDCWIKPAGQSDFINAEIVDLDSAEKLYEKNPRNQPRLLLRHRFQRQWDGTLMKRFQMRFSPVTLSATPVIKIRYLSPIRPYYDARRITLPLDEFRTYRRANPHLSLKDPDNPNVPPKIINLNSGYQWQKNGEYWTVSLGLHDYVHALIRIAPESQSRNYLRVFDQDGTQFYQMSVLPPITPDDHEPKNILLAFDLTDKFIKAAAIVQSFEKAVELSTSERDSITMLYSAFTPEIYDSNFVPVTAGHLQAMFERYYQQPVPTLNTLPHLLRQAVNIFNLHDKPGEIWLLTDAYTHSDPPETAMEIINQTLGEAKKDVVFRIISADQGHYGGWWRNTKYYYGNDYLYENLARLSWGSFIKLREYPFYDFLDAMLDAIAPSAAAVEVDAEPTGGLSYSRFQLNRGRTNFPITLPYYEIGLFDGSTPFQTHFYGMVDGDLFAKDVAIDRAGEDPGWKAVATFWFDRYIQNLLLEPQSYETIDYIENVSVQQRLLTPYSGFIVPGPGETLAFQRLTESIETAVETPQEPTSSAVPEDFKMLAFPNPFNSSTVISFQLPQAAGMRTVHIKIFNTLGQLIQDRNIDVDGTQTNLKFRWDGMDQYGNAAASGIYLVMINAGNVNKSLKVTLVR